MHCGILRMLRGEPGNKLRQRTVIQRHLPLVNDRQRRRRHRIRFGAVQPAVALSRNTANKMQIAHHGVRKNNIPRQTVHCRVGQQLNPGGELRLETGDSHFSQLLLKRLHRLAVIPHRFHIPGRIQRYQRIHKYGLITGRQHRLNIGTAFCRRLGWKRLLAGHFGDRRRLVCALAQRRRKLADGGSAIRWYHFRLFGLDIEQWSKCKSQAQTERGQLTTIPFL